MQADLEEARHECNLERQKNRGSEERMKALTSSYADALSQLEEARAGLAAEAAQHKRDLTTSQK